MSDSEPFDFGTLGEQWWRDAAADLMVAKPALRISDNQIRFAAAKHRGCSDIESARQAGYATHNKESLKQAAYKAAHATAVVELLSLAALESQPERGTIKLVDDLEVMEILSKQIRSNDPNTVIRASELYNKIKERAHAKGATDATDGFSDWRNVRDFLTVPGGAPAIVHLLTARGESLGSLALLHDVHAACIDQDPDLWERKTRLESTASQAWLQRLLGNPNWQRDARIKLWNEIGIDIEDGADPLSILAERNEQATATGFNGDIVGHDNAGGSAWELDEAG